MTKGTADRYDLKMRVVITDPNCKPGMVAEMMFDYNCYFTHDPDTYGNGWYAGIYPKDKQFGEKHFDLRYTEYRITSMERAKEFLTDWANGYWTGENGAWKVKQITFS